MHHPSGAPVAAQPSSTASAFTHPNSLPAKRGACTGVYGAQRRLTGGLAGRLTVRRGTGELGCCWCCVAVSVGLGWRSSRVRASGSHKLILCSADLQTYLAHISVPADHVLRCPIDPSRFWDRAGWQVRWQVAEGVYVCTGWFAFARFLGATGLEPG